MLMYTVYMAKTEKWVTNYEDPDQAPHARSVTSDLGLHFSLRPVCPYTLGKYDKHLSGL